MEVVIPVVFGLFLIAWFGNMLTRMVRSVERIEEHLASMSDSLGDDGRAGPPPPD